MAIVGARFADLDKESVTIGAANYANQGRARVMAENEGLVHLYAECGSGRLIGAELFGPRVEHMAHLLAWSCQQGLSVPTILEMPFYHPRTRGRLAHRLERTGPKTRSSSSALRGRS